MKITHAALLTLCALILFSVTGAVAQSDKEIKAKQSTLKQAANENAEKNQTIQTAASDKPEPTSSLFGDAETRSTGYDFTQVKGYMLTSKADYDRIDQMFRSAFEIGFIDKEYTKNGAFTVPGSTKPGTAQIRRVEVYYVRSLRSERENLNAPDFELLEVRVEKQLNIPEKEEEEEGGDEDVAGMRRRRSRQKTVVSAFKLAGSDLITCINLFDEGLRGDLLSRRTQEEPIALPRDLATDYTRKRGPFVVRGDDQLDLMKGIFRTFWSPADSVRYLVVPQQAASTGDLSASDVPLFLAGGQSSKILLQNMSQDTAKRREPVKITAARFIGDNADQFQVLTKLPIILDPRKPPQELEVRYVGESKYEVPGVLAVDAKELNMSQDFDVVSNPGVKPVDVAVLDASLFGIELRSPARSPFAPNWNIGFKFGNDEINLPRWTSGMGSLYIGYKNDVHVGLVMPLQMVDGTLPAPLGFNTNHLASPMGYTFDFDFTFGFPFSLGGNVAVMNAFDGQSAYTHLLPLSDVKIENIDYTNDFFNISTLAKLYYPLMFRSSETDPGFTFRVEVGGGYMQVNRNHLVALGERAKETHLFTPEDAGKMFSFGKEKDLFDVYFRISFINLASKNNYGLGLQYFNGGMLADAWLELTSWFRVQAKYSFLLRTKEVWEQEGSYFMVSPQFRFGFPTIFN